MTRLRSIATWCTWTLWTLGTCLGCATGGSGGEAHAAPAPQSAPRGVATFAGGCFWCMEPPFEKLDGVTEVISGYTGGDEVDPTYEEVSSGRTGHVEAVQVRFDPAVVSYERLLEVFWRSIDPTDAGGQFADRGTQYHTAIFFHDDEQRDLAEASKTALEASGRFAEPIVTPLRPAGAFYPAETYHQDYYKKQPEHYKSYRWGSGRGRFLGGVWGSGNAAQDKQPVKTRSSADSDAYGKPADSELRETLTPLQYRVTQEEGTEPAFQNAYWDNKAHGIYVDVVTGEPLFSSTHKYRSGTGWPSFFRPLEPDNIVERVDHQLVYPRTEVRSKYGDSHLGHLFPDGPEPTGQRYCINSAALRFVPKEDLEQEGYGEYLALFDPEDDPR